jgi:peptidoglycan-associated lipoprotein
MKIPINLSTTLAILCSALVVGCSSVPVEEMPTEIEDTTVQTAQLESVEAEIEVVEPKTDATTVFYFDFDKALLKAESRAALLEHAVVLNSNSSSVRLEGHADERGTREYNMALGERRAMAVKEFLVLQGVAANRIEVISYGEERAAAYGSNDQAWSLNRRVELK